MRIYQNQGFTLIEIMIAVGIVAILAVIAIPSFTDQIRKSRRSEAISAMQDAQLRLERWRVDHPSFAGSSTTIPDNTHYKFSITADAATPNDYSITGTPQGGQEKDLCGTLIITNTSGKISKSPSTVGCW